MGYGKETIIQIMVDFWVKKYLHGKNLNFAILKHKNPDHKNVAKLVVEFFQSIITHSITINIGEEIGNCHYH